MAIEFIGAVTSLPDALMFKERGIQGKALVTEPFRQTGCCWRCLPRPSSQPMQV